jgi:hypothetical protein
VCVVIDCALKKNKKNIKIHNSKIFFTCSISKKKIHYCVKVVILFSINKTPKLLVPTNIRLNNDIDYVQKLNELKEQLISPFLAFDEIWQL